MAQPENMSVLIADAEAEEVKLLTIEIRNVFPYCRVEAIYSADEVLAWVSRFRGSGPLSLSVIINPF